MKDRIFEGSDKEAALQRASETLGVPVGRAAPRRARGARGTRPGRGAGRLRGGREQQRRPGAGTISTTKKTTRRRRIPPRESTAIVAAISRAADIDVKIEVVESPDRLMASLSGPDAGFFTADEGRALTALEYLLQRTYGDAAEPRKILVDAAGYREQREAGLRQRATELAQAVSGDGETRSTEPLNSYERRIVHMVVADLAGLSSRSEGQGSRRRVFIESALEQPEPRRTKPTVTREPSRVSD